MSFLSRLFRRKPPVVDRRRSNDWKPGDLAVCVDDDWIDPDGDEPRAGDVLLVTGVGDVMFTRYNIRAYGLHFKGLGDQWFIEDAFRKPVEDIEAAEAEFTQLIKRPVRKPGRVRA